MYKGTKRNARHFDEKKFIAGLYRAFFQREAAEHEIAAHVDGLRSGQSPEQIVDTFLQSPEHKAKNKAFNDMEFIVDLYRIFLNREPDQEGLAGYLEAYRVGNSPQSLVSAFLDSPEYVARAQRPMEDEMTTALNLLTAAPPMKVELALSASQQSALWSHVRQTWTRLGESEPYWSVLTDPQWKQENLRSGDALTRFYDSGRLEIERLDSWLARNWVSVHENATCVEFGCGVGRCTMWLAKRFRRVLAFDVSEPHIELAREQSERRGIHNIEFIPLRHEDQLAGLENIALFFSVIVLQHNPPPVIVGILDRGFNALSEGGLAYFQVPTYATSYSFTLIDYLNKLKDRGIEMHFVPQRPIFDLARAHHVRPLEIRQDPMISNFHHWVSTTFLLVKDGN